MLHNALSEIAQKDGSIACLFTDAQQTNHVLRYADLPRIPGIYRLFVLAVFAQIPKHPAVGRELLLLWLVGLAFSDPNRDFDFRGLSLRQLH